MSDSYKKDLHKLEKEGKRFKVLGQELSSFYLGILIFGIIGVVAIIAKWIL